MRWFLRIVLVLVLVLAAYTAWPLYGLYRLGMAFEARNASAVAELVDFSALRGSLTRQLMLTYLNLTGQDARLGRAATEIAAGLASSVADPIVARLINPESLIELLNRGSLGGGRSLNVGLPSPSTFAVGGVWRTWLNAEYSGRSFHVSLPVERPPAERFRLHLRLIQWRWKLSGIDLPERLRVELAQEIIGREKR